MTKPGTAFFKTSGYTHHVAVYAKSERFQLNLSTIIYILSTGSASAPGHNIWNVVSSIHKSQHS